MAFAWVRVLLLNGADVTAVWVGLDVVLALVGGAEPADLQHSGFFVSTVGADGWSTGSDVAAFML